MKQLSVQQQREIEKVNRDLNGFMVLAGIECNIDADGNLDIGNKSPWGS